MARLEAECERFTRMLNRYSANGKYAPLAIWHRADTIKTAKNLGQSGMSDREVLAHLEANEVEL